MNLGKIMPQLVCGFCTRGWGSSLLGVISSDTFCGLPPYLSVSLYLSWSWHGLVLGSLPRALLRYVLSHCIILGCIVLGMDE